MEAMMDAVGGCMMSDDHTCGIRQYEEHADFKQFIICGQDFVDWKCSRNVDVNFHLITYWNSCRCVADRDMRIYYDLKTGDVKAIAAIRKLIDCTFL
ncbi:hypothetical protein T4E_9686 [Trichinella pseudospiralis]|uniref:Uncharacterized protein n=1 Tax=Trichinella pseudospiralis TaxID=6337 RepID=A0A0V0Y8D3_TRIPS|nr:hypothetical protein T4E_9686 [Trichinella pseudospiralis]